MKMCMYPGMLLFLLFATTANAQHPFQNTLLYSDSTGSPVASISTLEWIAGYWRGEAFGGITEEVWTPPLGGTMMCAFKLILNQQVQFYELVTITEQDSSLILRLKHFHGDLKGWEEKDETVDFRLVKVEPNRVYFDGFTFERVSDEEMNIYVIIQQGGNSQEIKFPYKRQKL